MPSPRKPGTKGEPRGEEGTDPPAPGQPDLDRLPDPQSLPKADDLARELERLSRNGQSAAEQRRRAEALRKQAEQLVERMTPEQREKLERWAETVRRERPDLDPGSQGMAGRGEGRGGEGERVGSPGRPGDPRGTPGARGGGPFGGGGVNARAETGRGSPVRTETVDARPPTPGERSAGPRERVVAEWYGPGARGGGGLTPEAERTVRDAVRGGERAIDERAVAPRFDRLIERYFRRLPQRAEGPGALTPAGDPSKPAEPAKDAP